MQKYEKTLSHPPCFIINGVAGSGHAYNKNHLNFASELQRVVHLTKFLLSEPDIAACDGRSRVIH